MRETNFIEQNQEKWQEFEGFLDGEHKRADKLNDLFVQITDDLSYSRTFYPNRSVRVYLNGLAQRVFINIYKHRKSRWGNILKFWTDELPALMYEARRDLLLSFLIFMFTFGIGVLSSIFDSNFAEVILGEAYVEMTLSNIAEGDPMRVYKEMGPLGMSVGITVNNLFVAFLTFVLGVFLSIGAMVMIARTGFMVGAFQYFFIERDLFWDSFLTIWTHGTLEISAIIIAGAAGATMGRGLVSPGTYTRTQAFQRSARRGIKIMVGTIPLFIIAGFIEGFLTRNTEMPDFIRGIFILVCLLAVLVYFVWYPSVRAQVLKGKLTAEEELPPDNLLRIDFNSIKSSGTLFADSFLLFKSIFGKMIMLLFGLTVGYCLLAFGMSDVPPQDMYYYPGGGFGLIQSIHPLLTGSLPAVMWVYNALAFAGMAYFIFWQLQKMQSVNMRFSWAGFVSCMLGGTIMALVLHLANGLSLLLFIIGFGAIMLWMSSCFQERIDPLTGLARSGKLLAAGYWQSIGLLLLTSSTGMIFATLADTGLADFFFELVTWVVNFDGSTMSNISVVMLTFLYIFLLYGVMSMLLASFGLFYHSRLEATEANTLRKMLKGFGENKQIRGLAKE